jgi:hypothetical protein
MMSPLFASDGAVITTVLHGAREHHEESVTEFLTE